MHGYMAESRVQRRERGTVDREAHAGPRTVLRREQDVRPHRRAFAFHREREQDVRRGTHVRISTHASVSHIYRYVPHRVERRVARAVSAARPCRAGLRARAWSEPCGRELSSPAARQRRVGSAPRADVLCRLGRAALCSRLALHAGCFATRGLRDETGRYSVTATHVAQTEFETTTLEQTPQTKTIHRKRDDAEKPTDEENM